MRLLRRLLVAILLIVVGALALRTFEVMRGPTLMPWHLVVPPELSAEAIDGTDWRGYLAAEDAAFATVRREVTDKLTPDERSAVNRYDAAAPMYPGRFAQDWNRSYVALPAGAPVGVAVMLHGLTDSPYSQRRLAQAYVARGFAVVAPRMPGHGTVPAGLTTATRAQWIAATRLAVREARRLVPAPAPLHVVGYSNGGALATLYAVDALADPTLAPPQAVILISPMIGVTRFARFAGVAGWPALFPAFAKAAWLGIEPEYNPFKYNSFPVRAARESYALTRDVQRAIDAANASGRLARIAPILTFQSVVDFTVSTPAIVRALYDVLPANGSEIVVYDVNRNANFDTLLRPSARAALTDLFTPAPRRYTTVVIAEAPDGGDGAVARTVLAGSREETVTPLSLGFPSAVFSLSHIALPFPPDDPLYGITPDRRENFGVRLGTLALRGERSTLIVTPDAMLRLTSNPFYADLAERIVRWVVTLPAPPANAAAIAAAPPRPLPPAPGPAISEVDLTP